MSDPILFLGQITKIHGLKGEVFTATTGEFFSLLQERYQLQLYKDAEISGGIVMSAKSAGEARLSARPRKVLNGYLLQFTDAPDRTAAEKYKNLVIGIAKRDFVALVKNPEEYLVSYLGMNVIDNATGETVAQITGVEENARNVWLTAKLIAEPHHELVIPLAGDTIAETNYAQNYLKVNEYQSFIA